MEWSHRPLSEVAGYGTVFGIQIITWTPVFLALLFAHRRAGHPLRTSREGFDNDYPWKKWKEETFGKADKDGKRQLTERANMIVLAAKALNLSDNLKATLILPMDGGPAFLRSFPIVQPKKDCRKTRHWCCGEYWAASSPHPDRLMFSLCYARKQKRMVNWKSRIGAAA